MEKNGSVYVGIPLEYHLDALATTPTPTTASTTSTNTMLTSTNDDDILPTSSSNGLLAFFVGVTLASLGWVANQGWTIVSLLLFGQFTWTLESAWKHILLCIFGALCTAIAFWAVFKMIFPNVLDDEEDEEGGEEGDDSNKALSYKRDVSNALQDLGELGFVVGYFGSQTFLTTPLYKPLVAIGVECENSNVALNGATLIFMMLWMLCTKMRDYNRAMKREQTSSKNVNKRIEPWLASVEIV